MFPPVPQIPQQSRKVEIDEAATANAAEAAIAAVTSAHDTDEKRVAALARLGKYVADESATIRAHAAAAEGNAARSKRAALAAKK